MSAKEALQDVNGFSSQLTKLRQQIGIELPIIYKIPVNTPQSMAIDPVGTGSKSFLPSFDFLNSPKFLASAAVIAAMGIGYTLGKRQQSPMPSP